jgi:tripartite-type tricarboxylate transporter receptor subunit TctC
MIFSTARTPAPVIDTLNRAVEKIMQDPQVRKAVSDLALEPVYLPGQAFKDQIAKEVKTFGDVAKRADIKLE